MDSISGVFFQKQLDFANQHQCFQDCQYYPCHDLASLSGQESLNCLFCYCPFYPCENAVGKGSWIKTSENKPVWDCSECVVIHKNSFVKDTLEALYSGKSFQDILGSFQNSKQEPL